MLMVYNPLKEERKKKYSENMFMKRIYFVEVNTLLIFKKTISIY